MFYYLSAVLCKLHHGACVTAKQVFCKKKNRINHLKISSRSQFPYIGYFWEVMVKRFQQKTFSGICGLLDKILIYIYIFFFQVSFEFRFEVEDRRRVLHGEDHLILLNRRVARAMPGALHPPVLYFPGMEHISVTFCIA